jgi:long-chain fatty acid transport protein
MFIRLASLTRGLLLAAVLISLAIPAAWAGGLWLYERATPEVGTANAGVAARAGDASTALSNPAGMTRLERPQLLGGIQPMFLDVQFAPNAATTTTGPSGDASGFLPAGSFFYVHPLSKDWRIGFSVASTFGLGAKYEDDWVGRYYVQQSDFLTIDFVPSLAYRVNDWLSVGAGFAVQLAYVKTQAAINNALPSLADGQFTYEDTAVGFGGNVGILIEPWKGTRFGLVYATPIKQTFNDVPQFSGLGPGLQAALTASGVLGANVEIEMTIPQGIMFSVFHQINPQWAMMGNLGWQHWTQFGEVPISISSTTTTNLTEEEHFHDTVHVAIGAHFRFHPKWTATAGFAYDSSPVSEGDRSLSLPLDQQFRYSVGLMHAPSDRITLGLAYTFMDAGSAPLTQTRGPLSGTVSGEYTSNFINIIALYIAMRF